MVNIRLFLFLVALFNKTKFNKTKWELVIRVAFNVGTAESVLKSLRINILQLIVFSCQMPIEDQAVQPNSMQSNVGEYQ